MLSDEERADRKAQETEQLDRLKMATAQRLVHAYLGLQAFGRIEATEPEGSPLLQASRQATIREAEDALAQAEEFDLEHTDIEVQP